MGGAGQSGFGGAGGGGSFVVGPGNTPLIIAGAGGGASVFDPAEVVSLARTAATEAVSLVATAVARRVPQVNIPSAEVDGFPVGLSIIGESGSDATLIAVALRFTAM